MYTFSINWGVDLEGWRWGGNGGTELLNQSASICRGGGQTLEGGIYLIKASLRDGTDLSLITQLIKLSQHLPQHLYGEMARKYIMIARILCNKGEQNGWHHAAQTSHSNVERTWKIILFLLFKTLGVILSRLKHNSNLLLLISTHWISFFKHLRGQVTFILILGFSFRLWRWFCCNKYKIKQKNGLFCCVLITVKSMSRTETDWKGKLFILCNEFIDVGSTILLISNTT